MSLGKCMAVHAISGTMQYSMRKQAVQCLEPGALPYTLGCRHSTSSNWGGGSDAPQSSCAAGAHTGWVRQGEAHTGCIAAWEELNGWGWQTGTIIAPFPPQNMHTQALRTTLPGRLALGAQPAYPSPPPPSSYLIP